MKFKWMMLAAFLVCLFAISAVGAADNATDDAALAENTADWAAIDNRIINDSDSNIKSSGDSLGISDISDGELKGEDINLTVEHEKVMTKNDKIFIALSDNSGRISILMDGKEVYRDNDFWFYLFSFDELFSEVDYGNHTLEVKYLGNTYFPGEYNPTSYKSTLFYTYVDLYADSEGYITIESEEEVNAKLYLDGDLIYDGKIDGYTTVPSKNLYLGYVPNYTIVTSGKGKYNAITVTDALDYHVYPEIDGPSTMGKGDDKYIKVTLPPDANGNLKVYINDIDVNASFENGKSVIPLNALDIGDYRVRIVYDSDSKYESYDGDYYNVKVTYNPNLKITVPSVAYLTDSTVTFTGSKDVEGKISIYVDRIDKTFKGDYKNGIAKIKIFDEEPGPKTYHYKFEGTYNGEKFEYNGEFNVTLTLLTVSLPKTVYEGQSFKVTFTGPQSMNGVLEASYAVNEGVIVKKGKATLTFSGLKAGVKKISYYFREFSSSFKVNVIKPPVIKANDFKTLYTSKKAYTVRILNNQSKSVGAGKTVTFYLYKAGKVKETKTSKTDSKGYAKVNFNVAPGSYKVKTKYGATAVTKKYAVKPITTTKNVQKYKRYNGLSQLVTAKNFVFQASLKKVDGKYLKGKNVQITFYRQNKKGNLFKAYSTTKKTDSKGVVKFIYKRLPFKISSSELEGLLIGVKISYLKENNWGTLNVGSQSPPKYYFLDGW